ncbi:DUF1402 family protein [Rhodobium gokarnense]|uniref:DUF1402 family protein n=1 Tax=Rhodobium gokarnense TaxID=364296 RepID=A0ABT3HIB6_9HYPH|nr:DUF1402 family protein [Rhodobium gokarnense]MCW2310079.1 hypothetical protein [Rhodobium gokarnense]
MLAASYARCRNAIAAPAGLRRPAAQGVVAAALLALLIGLLTAPAPLAAAGIAKVIPVPPGNRMTVQPEVPVVARNRTRETKDTFEGKYRAVYDALEDDRGLIEKIEEVAAIYDIDPLHMIGAIVGEHTYNVNAIDTLQTYYLKALEYAGTRIVFAHDGETVMEFVERPEFDHCKTLETSNRLWSCRESVWENRFRGRIVDGTRYDNVRFGRAFFQPLFAGQTFGLGQLNPLTALKMNDTVVKIGGLDRLDPENAPEVYRAIMDPDTSLHYVAAVIKVSIDSYREIARFDISGNPGLTATLYNVGNAPERAEKLRRINARRAKDGRRPVFPVENYYGWLVNEKLDELRKLL